MTSAKLIERIMANRALFEARQVGIFARGRPSGHVWWFGRGPACPGGCQMHEWGPRGRQQRNSQAGMPPPSCCLGLPLPRSHRPRCPAQAKKLKSESEYYQNNKQFLQEI